MTFAWKSSEMNSKRKKKEEKEQEGSVYRSEETFDHLPNENL